jgi:hypothetical protein
MSVMPSWFLQAAVQHIALRDTQITLHVSTKLQKPACITTPFLASWTKKDARFCAVCHQHLGFLQIVTAPCSCSPLWFCVEGIREVVALLTYSVRACCCESKQPHSQEHCWKANRSKTFSVAAPAQTAKVPTPFSF